MKPRLIALAMAFALMFAALLGRVAWLQIVDGERYAARANDARRRVEFLAAPRGRIVDRAGRVLAADIPTFRLAFVLADLDPGLTIPARAAWIIRKPRAALEARWRAAQADPALAVAEAPSPASVKAFRKLAARCEGLSVEGNLLRASPALLGRRATVLARVARLTGIAEADLAARVEAAAGRALDEENPVERAARLNRALPLTAGVPFEVAAEVEEEAFVYPGIEVEVVPERRYPYGPVAAHAIGTVGAPEPRRAEAFGASGSVPARAGADGIEEARNVALAGVPGARVVEWNRQTREYEVLGAEPPVPGVDVRLTIDAELQRAAEAVLDDVVARYAGPGRGGGAVVLLDARTGEVLVLASAPRYDLNRFRVEFAELRTRRPEPLLHRPIAARLPPGSIVKTLTAAAGLESGILTPEGTIHCEGVLNPANRRIFKCNGIHGDIAVRAALARSCNVFFYRTGERLGEQPLAAWMRAFGFGAATGIELQGERAGRVPTGAWKRARHEEQKERVARGERALARAATDLASAALRGPAGAGGATVASAARELESREKRLAEARVHLERTAADSTWNAGDDRNTAIGQGNLVVTPIQAARLAAAIASGGKLFRPRLVLETGGVAETPDESHMDVSPATWAIIRAGMVDCVQTARGTAHASGLAPFDAAAKTGTAQAPGGSHAWVIGFAPAGAPRVAFAVVIEHVADGLHGGDVAGPVAAKILEAYGRLQAAPGSRLQE